MSIDPSFLDAHGGSIAGFCGAIVSSVLRPGNTLMVAILDVVCGLFCAVYLGPFVVAYLDLTGQLERGAYFLTGVLGVGVLRGIMAAVEKYDFTKHLPKGDK